MSGRNFVERDYFTDLSVLLNPYEYFEEIRAQGPVYQMQTHDALFVSGYDECIEVLRNNRDFSSAISTSGAAQPLPFEPEGEDISEQIEAHRAEMDPYGLVVTYDGELHSKVRSIVNRLFTPSRLKANKEFMLSYSEMLVKAAVAKGRCEMVNEIATPYVTMVIADLLGVPSEDRDKFREVIDSAPPPGDMESTQTEGPSPLEYMGMFFFGYLQARRENPGVDVLSELAEFTYPDGSLPDLIELVKLSTFMFGAGQDTSAKLLSNATRFITETPGLQDTLRADPGLIPDFLEEVLRLEGSTKATFRLAVRDTKIGGVSVPAGKRIVVGLAAANRDPRRWEHPNEFQLKRPRIREHLAFGRGSHTCAGAPLAKAEVAVILEHFLKQTAHIALNEDKHGTPGNRTLNYEPSYIIRGLANLHVDLVPA
ncbi:cytochrome P450 [Aestuariicella hydrocarbonica]|uniref:Cytochrome P450 n=1 Tax=Pseudomaricurvus hydrocarbonicus TaxID=1470433 RepID=A0A9E5MNA1_9GAMM|nr:cytochrome P450 [Aestuariicella hydrocarbonica]NHO67408.1 cytochrome P450 [Aestuariicella hydrocarbonica]